MIRQGSSQVEKSICNYTKKTKKVFHRLIFSFGSHLLLKSLEHRVCSSQKNPNSQDCAWKYRIANFRIPFLLVEKMF